ncbi:MAG: 6,7-dimethyl-8-ribityllumazine synthase [Elusimicrobia bacterium]|jgi:6,7-dimethyl-8-ribityllumazine synthase|nr:6,7-dimethyl-8-ribityllumazine synthase [Elusimicrobiota bacterium]
MKIIKGKLSGVGKRAAIVISRRNEQIVLKLLEGAKEELLRNGMETSDITMCEVPGAWEIAACAKKIRETSVYDMIICLGAVIRGDTPHFEYVSAQVSRTVAEEGIKGDVPVSFGVLTCDSLEQALERSGGKSGNKGEEAARAALEMSDLYSRLR